MINRCGSCRFALKVGFDDYECRKRSPVQERVEHYVDMRGWVPRWPVMKSADWCGDYEWDGEPKHPPARRVPLFPRTARDPFGMGDGCQAWFDVDQTRLARFCPSCVTPIVCVRDGECVREMS